MTAKFREHHKFRCQYYSEQLLYNQLYHGFSHSAVSCHWQDMQEFSRGLPKGKRTKMFLQAHFPRQELPFHMYQTDFQLIWLSLPLPHSTDLFRLLLRCRTIRNSVGVRCRYCTACPLRGKWLFHRGCSHSERDSVHLHLKQSFSVRFRKCFFAVFHRNRLLRCCNKRQYCCLCQFPSLYSSYRCTCRLCRWIFCNIIFFSLS